MTLELVRTPDILKGLGEAKGARLLVGFAAETEDLVGNARKKLEAKNLDLVVANDVTAPGAGLRRRDERGRPAAARRRPGGRAARLEAGGRGAHPRRGARLALGGRREPGKAARGRGERARRDPAPTCWPTAVSSRGLELGRSGSAVGRSRRAARRGGRPEPSPPARAGRAHGRPGAPPWPRSARTWATAGAASSRRGGRRSSSARATRGAELMFVGEAPGADEDEQGLAFVGRAGQLLTDIIEKGMKMKRSDVFIANVIKCRPPQNRNPEPDEILACQPFLEAQIRAIRPRVLVGLGKFAAPVAAEDGRAHLAAARAAGRATTASRSCRPTTPRTCCATRRPRRTSGRT